MPLSPKTNDRGYQSALETALERIARHRPTFWVIALGQDVHEADPIGGLALSTDYFKKMAVTIRQLGVSTMLVQEGG